MVQPGPPHRPTGIRPEPSRAAEYSAAASAGMWTLFDNVNVDDTLRENLLEAYQTQYPGLAR